MKFNHGEWMGLYTDDNLNFVKGHVTKEECHLIALKALRADHGDPELEVIVDSVTHHNGRFGIGWDECGERISWLYLNRPSGERGSFPVTEVQYSFNIYS